MSSNEQLMLARFSTFHLLEAHRLTLLDIDVGLANEVARMQSKVSTAELDELTRMVERSNHFFQVGLITSG